MGLFVCHQKKFSGYGGGVLEAIEKTLQSSERVKIGRVEAMEKKVRSNF